MTKLGVHVFDVTHFVHESGVFAVFGMCEALDFRDSVQQISATRQVAVFGFEGIRDERDHARRNIENASEGMFAVGDERSPSFDILHFV